jgi:hypothetical protein
MNSFFSLLLCAKGLEDVNENGFSSTNMTQAYNLD